MKLWIGKLYRWFGCCSVWIIFCLMINASQVVNPVNSENSIKPIIKIPRSQSHDLDFAKNIGEVYIENPKAIDVQILGAKRIRLFTLDLGTSRIVISDKLGNRLLEFTLDVVPNLVEIEEMLREIFPHVKIYLKAIKNIIFVSGRVPNPKVAQEVMKIIKAYIHQDDQIINNLEISLPNQVMIKVKIAEVRRNVSQELGIDWAMFNQNGKRDADGNSLSTFANGLASASLGKTAKLNLDDVGADVSGKGAFPIKGLLKSTGSTSSSTNTSGTILSYTRVKSGFSYNISAFLDAMASESLATILAEPTLVTLSGQTASFNVGGENPYKTTNGNGASNVEFKQFGISLNVTPTIISENLINLKVDPDISQPSQKTEDGISLETRKVSTTVELADGQSIVIAGLLKSIKDMTTTSASALAKLPFIGGLFKSSKDNKEEIELIVVVTAYIVKPFKEEMPLPTDAVEMTDPAEQILRGKLNKTKADEDLAMKEKFGKPINKSLNYKLRLPMHATVTEGTLTTKTANTER